MLDPILIYEFVNYFLTVYSAGGHFRLPFSNMNAANKSENESENVSEKKNSTILKILMRNIAIEGNPILRLPLLSLTKKIWSA